MYIRSKVVTGMLREKFLKYLTFEKRYSAHTLAAYAGDLDQFEKYVAALYGELAIVDITHFYIRSWIVSMMDAGLDARSVNRKITTLKTYYRFLLKGGHVATNPMLKIQSPKTGKKLPVFVEKNKMEMLLGADVAADDMVAVRNGCIVHMFYHTGVRLSELIGLLAGNVDLRKQQIKVLGKRSKERIVPIMPDLAEMLMQYGKLRPAVGGTYFFVDDDGAPLNRQYVYRLIRTRLSGVTTQRKRSPHVLRHTFATHMLDNGADINAIKELLGHSSLAATQVYTHNTIEKLKNIHARAHPRGNG